MSFNSRGVKVQLYQISSQLRSEGGAHAGPQLTRYTMLYNKHTRKSQIPSKGSDGQRRDNQGDL